MTRVLSQPRRAMVLAAGKGKRMAPLSATTPKALVRVGDRTVLDHVLDHLLAAGVEKIVVNTHHLSDRIETHLGLRNLPALATVRETTLLETGGGIRNALGHFGGLPFFAVNGDVLWRDGTEPALVRLARAWSDERMDALLLICPLGRAFGYEGRGDFLIDSEKSSPAPGAPHRLHRRPPDGEAPYLFCGVQILHPRLFANSPEGAFSLNLLYDRALAAGRLYGLVHDGSWGHVSRPEDIAVAARWISGA